MNDGYPNGLLSEREIEVLEYVAAGYSNREIARELILALGTIKTHIHNICGKLEASNRTQAAARARELGLIGEVSAKPPTNGRSGAPPNPFKGLRAFQEGDAGDFFGREALIEHLIGRLAEPGDEARFLAVVGPSGSGKSSVVNAGLIPALRRGGVAGSTAWIVTHMMPGMHPLEELEAALTRFSPAPPPGLVEQLRQDERGLARALPRLLPADPHNELLLVIDQFEEVFTLVESEAVRVHFLGSLLAALSDPHSRLRLVITLRADYFDRPFLYDGFGELIHRRNEIVLPMAPRELERAIVAPLEQVGVRAESGLVTTILLDVAQQPGSLPMLQYALTELFEIHEGRTLTLATYQTSGRVLGALARRADLLYDELDAPGKEAARQMFLRMVTLGDTTQEARRRVPWEEMILAAGDEDVARRIGRMFGKYRLLTFDYDPVTQGPVVEVAHEALLTEWGRLRDWINESRDDLRLQRQLLAAATEWRQAGHDPSYLLHGSRLAQFETWAGETTLILAPDQRAYLLAGMQERQRQEADRMARIAQQARDVRYSQVRLRLLAAVLVVATLLSATLAAIALNRTQVAQAALSNEQEALAASSRSETRARREAEVSRSLALAADARLALSAHNTELALALALEATRIDAPPAEVQLALSEAAYAPGTRRVLLEPNEDRFVWTTALSADGTRVLLALMDDSLLLVDLDTGRQVRLQGHSGVVTSLAFSPDGTHALSGAQDGTLTLWDMATGAIVRRFSGHHDVVTAVVFAPDGRRALSGSFDHTLIVWDLATGAIVRVLEGHAQGVYSVAISPDGTLALSGAGDASADLWRLDDGTLLRRFRAGSTVRQVAFTPDGGNAILVYGGCIQAWDVASGQDYPVFACQGADSPGVRALALSPDGATLLTGTTQGTLQVWDLASGMEVLRLMGHSAGIGSLRYSADGRAAISAASDGSVRLWDLHSGAEVVRAEGPSGTAELVSPVFLPDGQGVLAGTRDAPGSSLALYDAASGRIIQTFEGQAGAVSALAITADGRLALSGGEDGSLVVWDVASGQIVRRLAGHAGPVRAVAIGPDGHSAYSAAGGSAAPNVTENVIARWDLDTGQMVARWSLGEDEIRSMALGPDGRLLVGGTNSLVLLDAQSGAVIRRFLVGADEFEHGRRECHCFQSGWIDGADGPQQCPADAVGRVRWNPFAQLRRAHGRGLQRGLQPGWPPGAFRRG